jgi:hypothetical protein
VNKDLENLHNKRGQARLKQAVAPTIRAITKRKRKDVNNGTCS